MCRKTYYKVVYAHGSGLMTSAIMSYNGVEYKLGKVSFPNFACGPLCVFKRIKYARKFVSERGHNCCKIYKAKIGASTETSVWTNINHKESVDSLPSGTVLADWVELVKKVE